MNLESDLYLESFLKEYKKNHSYKQAYDFKTKMFGSLRAQRSALVPLFKLLDKIVEVKQKVDDTLDMSKAVVAPVCQPNVDPNPGWGEDDVPAIFRPLLISPEVTLEQEEEDLDLSEIDNLPPEVLDQIQMKPGKELPSIEVMLKRLSGLGMVCSATCTCLLLTLPIVLVTLFGYSCVCMQSLTLISGDWSNRS